MSGVVVGSGSWVGIWEGVPRGCTEISEKFPGNFREFPRDSRKFPGNFQRLWGMSEIFNMILHSGKTKF